MCMAVERHRHGVALERLLEPAATEERVDLERLALDGPANGRVVEDRDAPVLAEARQR